MDEPKPLYHYTSQKGLLGILESNKLWMTNILYLNDSSEFTHTLDLVKSELKKRKNKLLNRFIELQDNIYKTYEEIENFCNNFHDKTGSESYVFSLSMNKDDLNQWRGYCPEGGFCIEFDTKKLSSIMNDTWLGYKKKICIYDPEEKRNRVISMFDDIQTFFESNEDTEIDDVLKNVYSKTIDISSYIKHESFKHEREYRIIYQGSYNKIEYREGKSTIIPYIEFSPSDKDGKLPISKIFVGPTPHSELSKLSIESLLKSEKYKEVDVEISKIPYRSW